MTALDLALTFVVSTAVVGADVRGGREMEEELYWCSGYSGWSGCSGCSDLSGAGIRFFLFFFPWTAAFMRQPIVGRQVRFQEVKQWFEYITENNRGI